MNMAEGTLYTQAEWERLAYLVTESEHDRKYPEKDLFYEGWHPTITVDGKKYYIGYYEEDEGVQILDAKQVDRFGLDLDKIIEKAIEHGTAD